MKVIFGFSKAKHWYQIGSLIISLAEKRPYSHVFIKYGDEVFQAAHGKVHTLPYGDFLKSSKVIKTYTVDYSEEEFRKLLAFRDSVNGNPYSKTQIVILTFLKLFGIKRNLMINGTLSFICSELASYIASLHGIPTPNDKDTITPSDFETILTDYGLQEDKI